MVGLVYAAWNSHQGGDHDSRRALAPARDAHLAGHFMIRRRLPLMLLAGLGACASIGSGASTTPSGPVRGNGPLLIGTWELVSTRVTRGDNTVLDERAPTIRALKVLNGTH